MLRKYRSFIILGAVLLAGFIGWLVYRELFTFYLKETSPDTSSVSYASPYIKLNFNKQLKTDGYTLGLSRGGQEVYTEHEVEGKTLKVYLPTKMGLNEQFSLMIDNLSATNGKTFSTRIDFATQDIPYDQLDKDQQDEILRLQDALGEDDVHDPILRHLPYGTLTYNLSPYIESGAGTDIPGDRLIIKAEIMLSGAEAGSAEAVERIKGEITDWIRSLGLDPANYDIQYETPQTIY